MLREVLLFGLAVTSMGVMLPIPEPEGSNMVPVDCLPCLDAIISIRFRFTDLVDPDNLAKFCKPMKEKLAPCTPPCQRIPFHHMGETRMIHFLCDHQTEGLELMRCLGDRHPMRVLKTCSDQTRDAFGNIADPEGRWCSIYNHGVDCVKNSVSQCPDVARAFLDGLTDIFLEMTDCDVSK